MFELLEMGLNNTISQYTAAQLGCDHGSDLTCVTQCEQTTATTVVAS